MSLNHSLNPARSNRANCCSSAYALMIAPCLLEGIYRLSVSDPRERGKTSACPCRREHVVTRRCPRQSQVRSSAVEDASEPQPSRTESVTRFALAARRSYRHRARSHRSGSIGRKRRVCSSWVKVASRACRGFSRWQVIGAGQGCAGDEVGVVGLAAAGSWLRKTPSLGGGAQWCSERMRGSTVAPCAL